ncbi:MAG: glycosyltransferase family 2 protein [bacterium]
MQIIQGQGPELTVLMPCLNEARTLAFCINKAKQFFKESGVNGEVLIADNGSTDGSIEIAISAGALCIAVKARGYGAALRAGITSARGKYIVMGDSDMSYDFFELNEFMVRLRGGSELVMGNRFLGGIRTGAMPFLHRYLGNPVLSFLGRLFFKSKIGDFHCGLRGFRKESIEKLNLESDGMEYASEMIVKATLAGLSISEVPVVLSKDGRDRPPHLRSFRDGWRHLKFLLLMSPRWLFLYPGLIMSIGGFVGSAILYFKDVYIFGVAFSVHTLIFLNALTVIGVQTVYFAIIAKAQIASTYSYLREGDSACFMNIFSIEKGIGIGAILFLAGMAGALHSVYDWKLMNFGSIIDDNIMRTVSISTALLVIGVQTVFSSFLLELVGAKLNTK